MTLDFLKLSFSQARDNLIPAKTIFLILLMGNARLGYHACCDEIRRSLEDGMESQLARVDG